MRTLSGIPYSNGSDGMYNDKPRDYYTEEEIRDIMAWNSRCWQKTHPRPEDIPAKGEDAPKL